MPNPLGIAVNKPVSLVIPFSLIGILSAAQLWLGTSPAIVAMCAAAAAMPFLQMRYFGRDLYAVLGLTVSLKYVGFALAAKTFYGQTLDSNLHDAYAAFGLTLLFITVLTMVLMTARAMDKGMSLFPLPMDLVSLRRLSVVCLGIGMLGNFLYAIGYTNFGGGGAAVVLGTILRDYFYLGLIAEAVYALIKTGGRSFVTRRLLFWFIIEFIVSMSFNTRELIVSCVISIIVVGFLYDAIRIRHVIICIILNYLFIFVFTPVTFYLRLQRTGESYTEFADHVVSTVTKAALDPEFLKLISETGANAYSQGDLPYDYYGVRSEVLDRLSFVSLVDAVYNGTRTREPIGMPAIEQTLNRVAPGFLGFDKSFGQAVGPGDWLSWQVGLEQPGVTSFTVFGLPMEGLAAWGLTGLIIYPFIFMLPVLYCFSRLSSFRLRLPVSIFLAAGLVHTMAESTSETFLLWLTMALPPAFLILFVLNYLIRRQPVPLRSRTV